MNSIDKLNFWIQNDYFDDETKKELINIKEDQNEVEERFYKDLEFGTGGLRGIIGAGTNRMNKYTVRKASLGLAYYVINKGQADKGIVIAYDSRRKSQEFAYESAKVFAAMNIKSFVFDELRPTPELSFAVRYLNAAAGIVITASHNPKEYNGYKVYSDDGAQLSLTDADAVFNEIEKITDITNVKTMNLDEAKDKELIKVVGKEIDDDYITKLKTLSVNSEITLETKNAIKIVFTPLHGAGNNLVRRILDETGFYNVHVVEEQESPDCEFSTVKSPNPEDQEALKMAIELAKEKNADIVIGTDPDGDRMGIVIKDKEGKYIPLTGNQTGCLLAEYILTQKKKSNTIPTNAFIVKTVVSTELARTIAANYNVELVEVLTGFKFIGEQIKLLDEFGSKKFIFGFEESYGYLAGTFVRDKDAVVASMLIAEMTAYFKSKNMSVYDGLEALFDKYGYYLEDMTPYTLSGREGLEKISNTMSVLRKEKHKNFGEFKTSVIRDYEKREKIDIKTGATKKIDLPKSNVLYYEMADGSWFCIRPSGTEPKIKIYYGVSEKTYELSLKKLNRIKDSVFDVVGKLL